jgi:hypothetical protein
VAAYPQCRKVNEIVLLTVETDYNELGAWLVVEGLKRLGWSEADLTARRKGERGKVQFAQELRSKTTMPLAWIAQRLQMGTWTHVSHLLNEPPETQPQAQEVLPLC